MNDEAQNPNNQNDDSNQDNNSSKITVSADTCIGCGICANVASEVFEMGEDGKSHVKPNDESAEIIEKANGAKEACPVDAIAVEEVDGQEL